MFIPITPPKAPQQRARPILISILGENEKLPTVEILIKSIMDMWINPLKVPHSMPLLEAFLPVIKPQRIQLMAVDTSITTFTLFS